MTPSNGEQRKDDDGGGCVIPSWGDEPDRETLDSLRNSPKPPSTSSRPSRPFRTSRLTAALA